MTTQQLVPQTTAPTAAIAPTTVQVPPQPTGRDGPGAGAGAGAGAERGTYYSLLGRDDVTFEIKGDLLGFASSQYDEHTHSGATVASGERCSACRWFEVRIFRVYTEYTDDCTCEVFPAEVSTAEHHPSCGAEPARARYLLLTYGQTIIPGELTRRRVYWTESSFALVEALNQRNDHGAFLPRTSALALAQASDRDDAIQNAYINRAVT